MNKWLTPPIKKVKSKHTKTSILARSFQQQTQNENANAIQCKSVNEQILAGLESPKVRSQRENYVSSAGKTRYFRPHSISLSGALAPSHLALSYKPSMRAGQQNAKASPAAKPVF